jgi:glycosyltransferase involved in cell wall biosynthesis
VVLDGQTGLLVPPDDPPALAAALERLLRDRRLSSRLGTAGRHHIATRFDHQQCLDHLDRLTRPGVES